MPKINIKQSINVLLWSIIAAAGIVLLVAAVQSKNIQTCKGIEIEISGVSNNFFIDQSDVIRIIHNFVGGKPAGKKISAFNLRDIENNLEKDVWIRNAELFFDNNEILRVSVDEREPVARVFSKDGQSFYIDSSVKILPLSTKFSARLPVFTGFPHKTVFLSRADSALIKEIKKISMLMQADSFLMAMIEQVDITAQRSFEMIPKIGDQLIVFGNAADAEEKLSKLKLFYKEVITKQGWSKYSVINLQYKNQVVAKIKDAADKSSDSLRALQIMQFLAEKSARQAADSVQTFLQDSDKNSADVSLIQHSIERDEPQQSFVPIKNVEIQETIPETIAAPVPEIISAPVKTAPVKINKPAAIKKIPATKKTIISKPIISKPITTKPIKKLQAKPTAQPKAIMPKIE